MHTRELEMKVGIAQNKRMECPTLSKNGCTFIKKKLPKREEVVDDDDDVEEEEEEEEEPVLVLFWWKCGCSMSRCFLNPKVFC